MPVYELQIEAKAYEDYLLSKFTGYVINLTIIAFCTCIRFSA